MLNRIVLSLALLAAVAGTAEAQESANTPSLFILPQLEYQVAPDGRAVVMSAFAAKRLTDNFGFMGFVLVSKPFAEAYAGPALFAGPLTLGIGAGVETVASDPKIGGSANLDFTRTALPSNILLIFEAGGSGPWGRFESMLYVHEKLGLGAMGQADTGIGPRIEAMPRDWLTFYGSMMYRWWEHDVVGLGGVRAFID